MLRVFGDILLSLRTLAARGSRRISQFAWTPKVKAEAVSDGVLRGIQRSLRCHLNCSDRKNRNDGDSALISLSTDIMEDSNSSPASQLNALDRIPASETRQFL
jgi:hypothetical protein